MRRNSQFGFSLAELLLALLILANIATFAIPKVLRANADAQRGAVFKEIIGELTALTYQGYLTGDIRQKGLSGYLTGQLNYVTKNYYNNSTVIPFYERACGTVAGNGFAYYLPNGVVICGVSEGTDSQDRFRVDWNGKDGPNLDGNDIILVVANGSNSDYTMPSGDIVKPGRFSPHYYNGNFKSLSLYRKIFD